jgi:restriction system protein
MARQSKKQARAAQRQQEAAIKLLALGGAFTFGPLFLGNTLIGKSLGGLTPIGLLMLAIGGGLFWLNRQKASQADNSTVVSLTPRTSAKSPTFRPEPRLGVDPALPTAGEPNTAKTTTSPTRPTQWSAEVFDVIEWRRFEALVEALFQQAGFETKSQSHGADQGVDIWLHSRNQPGAPVSIVQCKHWSGKKVGVDKMRELRGVMAAFEIKRGQYATSSSFTADALSFARENGINPLDANGLLTLIAKRTPEQQKALLDVALEGDYWRPTCVNCGTKMVNRTPRNGGKEFWGCVNYPKCKTVMQMRGTD